MGKYKKVLAWAAPIVVPAVVAVIRSVVRRRRDSEELGEEESHGTNRDLLDDLVDAGLSGLTKGRGRGRGK